MRKNGHGSRSSARLAWFRRGSNRPVRPARDVGFTAAASLLRVLRTRLVSSALLSPMPRDSKNHEKPSRHPHETSRLVLLKRGDDLLLGWPAVLSEQRLLSSAPDRGAALRHGDLDGVGVYPVGHDFGMLEHFANGVARRVVLLLPAVSVAAVGDHVRVLVHGGARVGWGVVPGKPTHDVDEPVGSPPARRSCDTRENVEAAAMTASPGFCLRKLGGAHRRLTLPRRNFRVCLTVGCFGKWVKWISILIGWRGSSVAKC